MCLTKLHKEQSVIAGTFTLPLSLQILLDNPSLCAVSKAWAQEGKLAADFYEFILL